MGQRNSVSDIVKHLGALIRIKTVLDFLNYWKFQTLINVGLLYKTLKHKLYYHYYETPDANPNAAKVLVIVSYVLHKKMKQPLENHDCSETPDTLNSLGK